MKTAVLFNWTSHSVPGCLDTVTTLGMKTDTVTTLVTKMAVLCNLTSHSVLGRLDTVTKLVMKTGDEDCSTTHLDTTWWFGHCYNAGYEELCYVLEVLTDLQQCV